MTNAFRNVLRLVAAGLALHSGLILSANGQALSPTSNRTLLEDTTPKDLVARYQDFSQYPPESRPLRASNWDLLHPWTVDTPTLPLTPSSWKSQLETLAKSGLAPTAIVQKIGAPSSFPIYNFAVNKLMLAGANDQLTARLTISPAPGSTTLPPVHILQAELIGDSSFGNQEIGSVPYTCDAGANPVCSFHWSAPSADKKYWGDLELKVKLSLQGKGDDYMALLHFYSSPIAAGKFTGEFQERLEDGSLLIDAGVNVQRRMACFVSANLFSVDKEIPTHHAERRMIVDPSMKTITFTFFGKIFRDYGHEGAFRLQDLKAQCENLPFPPEWFIDSTSHQAELEAFQSQPAPAPQPGRVYFDYNDFTYTTQNYPSSAFSFKEWQSPARIHKLELLNRVAHAHNDPAMLEKLKGLAQQR
jgi:hypothetical protein